MTLSHLHTLNTRIASERKAISASQYRIVEITLAAIILFGVGFACAAQF